MPNSPAFQARVDSAEGRLTLAGDCRAVDLDTLETALRDWAGAGSRGVDLSAAGQFDIGPAWILKRAIADAPTAPAVTGALPSHFQFLDQLLDGASVRTADIAPIPPQPAGLVRLGRAIEARGESWYEALTYGGRLLTTAGSAWRSWRHLRIPSVVRHAY